MKNSIYTFSLILVVFLLGCSNDDAPAPTEQFTDAESYFSDINFQGSVLIKKNGNTILNRSYGEANLGQNESNTPETKFRIGSVTKTFTAMAMVQLKRDGLIESFDQKLSEFDDEFPEGDKISIRHLLSHGSGLPDYVDAIEPIAKSGTYVSPEDILDAIMETVEEDGLLFEPGSAVSYSNSNFLIAALLIDELTDEGYEEYIRLNVLEPLNMNDTELGENEITESGYAHGYEGSEDVSSYPMPVAYGAGDWTSTTADLARWAEAVMCDWFTAEERNDVFPGDVPAGYTMFGLGWFKSNLANKDFYWHGGDISGFTALMGFEPTTGGIVIALSNQGDKGDQRFEIIETLLAHQF